MATHDTQACSFCQKHKDQVKKLIVGDAVAICDECVALCDDLLKDDIKPNEKIEKQNSSDPRDLKKYLDQHIVGQELAKMVLSVAVINHYKKIQNRSTTIDLNKTNILVLGPTGSGKTLLARTIAKYLDVPFVIGDATSITEAGYVGDDAEMLISRLYAASGYDAEKTKRGIVFIDEIDKIARKSESASITRDVSGEGVQQALLKIVEGTVCRFPSQGNRKNPNADMIEIDTTNILFIVGGAFVGLDNIVQKRRVGSSIGFSSKINKLDTATLDDVMPDDLIKYGLIPEFIGRFPNIVSLSKLTPADMINILTGVDNNLIAQYSWLFGIDKVVLSFEDSALEKIVTNAMITGTGARALQRELEKVLLPYMYNIQDIKTSSNNTVKITGDMVNNYQEFERK